MSKKVTPWLFPEIEKEVRSERSAAAREAAQRIRDEKRQAVEHLRGRDLQWLLDYLVDNGPKTEIDVLNKCVEESLHEVFGKVVDMWALWRIGKLWRLPQGVDLNLGGRYYLYGIRGVHEQQNTYHGKEKSEDGRPTEI